MKKLLFLLLAAALFAGCDKDDDAPAGLDVTMANVAGTYKITAATVSSGGGSISVFNDPAFFDVCDRDDTYTFSATGNYTVTDAGVTCTPSNNDASTYTVNTSAKTMVIDGVSVNVTSLTSTTMVLAYPNFGGSGATLNATFTRQ